MTISPNVLCRVENVVYGLLLISVDDARVISQDLLSWFESEVNDSDGYSVDRHIKFKGLIALSLLKMFVKNPLYTMFGVFCLVVSPLTLIFNLVV